VVIAGMKGQQGSLELKFDSVTLYREQAFPSSLTDDQIDFEPVCPRKTIPFGKANPHKIARILGMSKLSDKKVRAVINANNANPRLWKAERLTDEQLPSLYCLRLSEHCGAGMGPWSDQSRWVCMQDLHEEPGFEKASIPAAWSGMLIPSGAIKVNTQKISPRELHEQYKSYLRKTPNANVVQERSFWDHFRFHPNPTSKVMYRMSKEGKVRDLTMGTIYRFDIPIIPSRQSSSASLNSLRQR
jgi:hypothetical protein